MSLFWQSKSQTGSVATEDFLNPSTPLVDTPPPRPSQKIYSIAGVLVDRDKAFVGQFETPGRRHDFNYIMKRVALEDGKLMLIGTLAVTTYKDGYKDGHRGGSRNRTNSGQTVTLENVRATLRATQGGAGVRPTAPMRPQPSTDKPQNGPSPASEHKENQTEKVSRPPGEAAVDENSAENNSFSSGSGKGYREMTTNSTGESSYVGAMFLSFEPLDGNKLLGIPIDITALQLNARFAVASDSARRLLLYFSDLILNAFGADRNEVVVAKNLDAINQELA